jgi:PKD repeat protein
MMTSIGETFVIKSWKYWQLIAIVLLTLFIVTNIAGAALVPLTGNFDNNGVDRVPFDPTTGIFNTLTPIAYSDPCTIGHTDRYQAITGTAISFSTDHYVLTANTASSYRFQDYQFGSGQHLYKFTLPSSGTNGDKLSFNFNAIGSLSLGYGVGLIRSNGAWNITTLKDGTATDFNVTVSGLFDGGAGYVKILRDSERAYFTGTVYITTDPGTPQVTIYDTSYNYGYSGFTVSSASGSKTFQINSIEIRARCLIGLTNIPATQAGFAFTPAGLGQFATTGTWSFAGSTLTCTAAGNAVLPFQAIGSVAGSVHTFTPALANGTNYFYFGGYRLKFIASGGNSCVITLQTAAGVAQGTGSLTVTTSSGVFANPVVITNYGTSITVTVSGATGSISSGTTTATGSAPYFNVGTATCSFTNYSFVGTRYYYVPMLRGAQAGQYLNGSTIVPAMRYSDDLHWDTMGEYTTTNSPVWSAANGGISLTYSGGTAGSILAKSLTATTGYYTYKFKVTSGIATIGIKLYCGSWTMYWSSDSFYPDGGHPVTGTFHISSNDTVEISILALSSTSWVVQFHDITSGVTSQTTSSEYSYNLHAGTGSGIGMSVYSTGTILLTKLCCDFLETNSTNGSAVAIAGFAHGGMYDTTTWAGYKYIKSVDGTEVFNLSTLYGLSTHIGDPASFYFEDNTTNTPILALGGSTLSDINTTKATYNNFNTPLIGINSTHNGNTIFFGLSQALTGTTPPIYITEINLSSVTPPVPASSFTVNQTSGYALLPIQLLDTSTNNPTSWQWGYANLDTGGFWINGPVIQNPVLILPIGNWSINLTASNIIGSNTSTQSTIIDSFDPPYPIASFTSNVTRGPSPLIVKFQDTSGGGPVTSWIWDFAGGSNIQSTDQNPVAVFQYPGQYNINFTTGNINGSTSYIATNYITVMSNYTENALIPVENNINGAFTLAGIALAFIGVLGILLMANMLNKKSNTKQDIRAYTQLLIVCIIVVIVGFFMLGIGIGTLGQMFGALIPS